MGPRPIGRGNSPCSFPFIRRFQSFNGAATNWSRKYVPVGSKAYLERELQWGRDQLVAEIAGYVEHAGLRVGASMGPRPIGRGNTGGDGRRSCRRQRFNGAATNWSRKSEVGASDNTWGTASMGPRPIGRGNFSPVRRRSIPDGSFNGAATNWSRKSSLISVTLGSRSVLQWGRDQLVAEIRVAVHDARRRHGASMGPRPIGRGNRGLITSAISAKVKASMGPRPIGRGNPREQHLGVGIGSASMGPRPIGRGNTRARHTTPGHCSLQWGRDQLVAEIPQQGSLNSRRGGCFNGAATNWSRKCIAST